MLIMITKKKTHDMQFLPKSTPFSHWNGPTGVQRRTYTVHITGAVFLPYRTQPLKFQTVPIFFELLQVVREDELRHFSRLLCITEDVFQLLAPLILKSLCT